MAAPARVVSAPPVELDVTAYHAAIDGNYVYWTAASGNETSDAILWRAPVGGGRPIALATSAGYSFAFASGHIYYTDIRGRAIHRLDPTDRSDHVIARLASEPLQLVAGGGYVYWTAWGVRGVSRAHEDGGARVTLPVGRDRDAMFADDAAVYITASATGTVRRIAHGDGDTPARILARDVRGSSDIVVVDDWVYVAADNTLYRVPVAGGTAEAIATGGVAHRLAVAPHAVYWTTWGDDHLADLDDCKGFQIGTVRRVDAQHGAPELVTASCEVRDVIASAKARFFVEMSRLIAG